MPLLIHYFLADSHGKSSLTWCCVNRQVPQTSNKVHSLKGKTTDRRNAVFARNGQPAQTTQNPNQTTTCFQEKASSLSAPPNRPINYKMAIHWREQQQKEAEQDCSKTTNERPPACMCKQVDLCPNLSVLSLPHFGRNSPSPSPHLAFFRKSERLCFWLFICKWKFSKQHEKHFRKKAPAGVEIPSAPLFRTAGTGMARILSRWSIFRLDAVGAICSTFPAPLLPRI
jgi:hypothetical protein